MCPALGSALIDLSQIQRWRRLCKRTHGDYCNARHTDLLCHQLDTLNLVDVTSEALVTLPSSTSFVVLSYVWGDTPMFKTQTSNIHILRQPGSLSSSNTEIVLPDTIRDAIYLVKELGERYLWVDCLCIVQDAGEEEITTMLKAMARIYASATFTIVAAGGNAATHGLRGIGGQSRERTEDDFQDSTHRGGYPWNSKWASRGWTFQESLFSYRLLIFDGLISWVCGRGVWLEEDDDSVFIDEHDSKLVWTIERPHLGVPMGMMSLLPRLPSLGRWGMLVENYTGRVLTLESDIDRAFAGATEIMDATFPGGLFKGLPEFFFDIALLWQPKASIYRRNEETASWSWTGWEGQVECLSSWYPFFAGVYRDSGRSSDWLAVTPLKPTAQFHKAKIPGPAWVSISNDFYKYQALRDNTDAALPSGWQRQHHPDGDYFTTAIYEGFKYGFPLPSPQSLPSSKDTYSNTISCTGPRAFLYFGTIYYNTVGPSVANLVISTGQTVGSLTLHHYDIEGATTGAQCELLAISEAKVSIPDRLDAEFHRDDPLGWNVKKWESDTENVEMGNGRPVLGFYNVLWIGRNGDVAYRKGLGKVGRRAWNALGAATVDIRLG
jgi:Heterokaryon incompatibility protein (HET)